MAAEGDGWAIRSVAEEDGPARTLVRDITLVTGDRCHHERHVLRLYPPDEVDAALVAAGFSDIRRLARYRPSSCRPASPPSWPPPERVTEPQASEPMWSDWAGRRPDQAKGFIGAASERMLRQ